MNACARVFLLSFVALLAGVGCSGTNQVQTPRYIMNVPDYWPVSQKATKDGEPTKLTIAMFGTPIDQGVGNTAESEVNYDARTADVDVRIYTWPDNGGKGNPSEDVLEVLRGDPELQLSQSYVIVDTTPPECGRFPRKYKVGDQEMTPIDMLKRPGYRSIVAGARTRGMIFGVVSRFEWEQADMARNCHNLRNMQVQLQNLLDDVTFLAPPTGTPAAAAPPAAPAAAPAPSAAPPAPQPMAPADQAATQPQP